MPNFRKKPVVIEAVQLEGTADSFNQIYDWACPSGDTLVSPIHCGSSEDGNDDYATAYISTLEGEMRAQAGDWIIRGVKGEFYPCRNDIFAATYEPVE